MTAFLWILGSVLTFALVALAYACMSVAHEDDERFNRDLRAVTGRSCQTCYFGALDRCPKYGYDGDRGEPRVCVGPCPEWARKDDSNYNPPS